MLDQAAALPDDPGASHSDAAPAPSFRAVPWQGRDLIIGVVPLALERGASLLINRATLTPQMRWIWAGATGLALVWMVAYPLWAARRHQLAIGLPKVRTLLIEGLLAVLLLPVLAALVAGFSIGWQRLMGGRPGGSTDPLAALAESPDRFETIALAVVAIAVAPVVEEIFFRGFIYNALRRRLPVLAAVVLQALAFGLLHPFSELRTATVALIAGLLALVYEWRRNLVATIGLHSFQNAVGIAMITAAAAAAVITPTLSIEAAPHQDGQLITRVLPGGPAAQAGLQAGDIVTAVDGAPFTPGGLNEVIQSHEVGERIALQVLRNGQPTEVEVNLQSRRE